MKKKYLNKGNRAGILMRIAMISVVMFSACKKTDQPQTSGAPASPDLKATEHNTNVVSPGNADVAFTAYYKWCRHYSMGAE